MIRFRISGYVFRISEPVVLERVEILSLIEQFQFNFLDDNRWQFILSGLKNTIIITFFAVLLGIFLGFVIAIVRSTHDKTGKLKILNVICRVYLTVIRGTPTMVQLLIVFYVIFATIDPGKIVVAIIAFGMNSAAYVAEIVRSGIMSIDQGQFEAGRSLGLNYTQTMIKIILPQAVKNILPALGNEFITLLKDTSLITVIGGKEMTYAAKAVIAKTYQGLFPLFGIALMYLLLVMLFSKLLGVLERRLRQSDRR